MRIFQVLENLANVDVPENQTWYRNLHEPLIEMGHDVVLLSPKAGRLAMQRKDRKLRARFSQLVLDKFRTEHKRKPFDLFFSYLMDGMIDAAAVDEVRKSGIPTCNFSCNNTHQFENVDEISPHFDYNLHSEKDARAKFLAIGANPLWWPMASNPKYFAPIKVERTIPVTFVGANYALRARYVGYLLDNGVDVHAYGPGWIWGTAKRWRSFPKRVKYLLLASLPLTRQRQYSASSILADHDFRRYLASRYPNNLHSPVSDTELVRLYSASCVSLGFLEVYNGHDPGKGIAQHLHLREFEAPMCGALLCTGFTNELADMFEPDREILVYRNQYELLDKVQYYFNHPAEAEDIRKAGRARALVDHTYQNRFKTLFAHLNLPH
jgi:spore maturation protein CgeB